ncbi:hypothetical protein E1J06_14545 [Phocaeicola dorei]|jgi:hypothetical protein|uniref:DUF7666 domain-containing protein n=1 Tax=Phocaeicola dorei TaxID=357276 RepID=A0AAX2R5X3_9BACT|nr:hypothetical protein [Phocaeicola dorei]TDB08503.1 hypothetical protein E1J06_14545 [Phocaeicola dorei]TDB12543.1 hypothetical protein E1I71_13380 [Phocaeicola dorei]TDB15905.1 hypothetical protein E1I95_14420 [Phocaeicola dorei]
MEQKIKAYKAFDKDLSCRGFKYEVGKEYEETGDIKACKKGFHACPYPLDVFGYYAPARSRFCEVEQSGQIDDSESDKVCSSKIRIGAELDIRGLVKAAISFVKERCTNECNAEPGKPATAGYRGAATAGNYGAATAGDSGAATAGDRGAATAGNYGAATAGDSGAATAGYRGAATAGDSGAATAGDSGAATAGDSGAATAGYRGAATAGNYGAATAGDSGAATAGDSGAATAGNYGAATAGDSGAATARGKASTGSNGLSVARGNNVQVKGGIGAILVIAEEREDTCDIVDWKAVLVDGEVVKADTWYRLENGELVEVD